MSAGDEFHRRSTDGIDPDKTDEEILRLIRQATNDDQKALLIAVYQVNRSQIRLGNVISGVVDRLEAAERTAQEHSALVTKGAGAWRGLALSMVMLVGLLSIVGTLAGYIWLGTVDELRKVSVKLGAYEAKDYEADKRITVLESTIKDVVVNQIDNRQHFGELERAMARMQQEQQHRR